MDRLKRYFPIPYLIVASVVIALLIRGLVREPSTFLAAIDARLKKRGWLPGRALGALLEFAP